MFTRNTDSPAALPRRVLGFILGAAVASSATASLAGQVTSGNNDVSVTLSGQVNRAILFADNGTESEAIHVDNSNSSSRLLLAGNGRLNRDVTLGTQIEVELASNPSDSATLGGGGGGGGIVERKAELFFDHRRYGKLWLGRGDAASYGTSAVDLSGTTVVANSGITDMAGGITFAGGPAIAINDVFNNYDGLGLQDRIRYDSPNLNNFVLSASHSGNGQLDFAARYSGSLKGGLKIAAAGGYATTDTFDQISGSVSALFKSGLNLTGAIGQQEPVGGGTTESFWYAKAGFIKGVNAFSVDMTQASDVAAAGDTFTSFGAAYVRKYSNAGTELYVGLRSHALDRGGTIDDVMTVLAGARIKF